MLAMLLLSSSLVVHLVTFRLVGLFTTLVGKVRRSAIMLVNGRVTKCWYKDNLTAAVILFIDCLDSGIRWRSYKSS